MSNELMRYTAGALAKTDEQPVSRVAGGALVKTAAGGAVLYGAAGLIPFVTFPMLLVLAFLVGGYLYIKD